MPKDPADHLKEKAETPDDPLGRRQWFRETRIGADGRIVPGVLRRASQQRRQIERRLREERLARLGLPTGAPLPPGPAGTVNWTPLGPSAILHGQASNDPVLGGRIMALGVGKDEAGNIRIYAGAANGGVWFSPDGGKSWTPLDEFANESSGGAAPVALEADSLAVGSLAVKFGANASSDLLYVGTGEIEFFSENPAFRGDNYFGVGVKVSSDGGNTFTLEASNLAGHGIFRIVIDPDDPTVAYAATGIGLFKRKAGAAWDKVSSATFSNADGAFSDLIVTGAGGNKVFYAGFWGVPAGFTGFTPSQSQVYTSTDFATWTQVPGVNTQGVRVSLSACEANPDAVYAFQSDGTLLRLVSGTFQNVTIAGSPNILGSQGTYDLVLAADPSNADVVYLAGAALPVSGDIFDLPFYRCTITGGTTATPSATPALVGTGVHADAHAFAFTTNTDGTHDPNNAWVGNDGGIFQSTSPSTDGSFSSKTPGLNITEITYLAQRPDTDAALIAGCQDNGTIRNWGEPAWYEAPRGDGGGVAVDPNNPFQMMRQYVRAVLYSCTDGGASGNWSLVNFPPTAAGGAEANSPNISFYGSIPTTPVGVSPTLLAFGTYRPWLSSDWGATWVTLPTNSNPYGGGGSNLNQDVLDPFPAPFANANRIGFPITAMTFGSATQLLVATRNGVWRLDLSGGTWTKTAIDQSALPAGHIITSLAVDNAAGNSFYATLGGSGFSHIWYFDGSNWNDANTGAAVPDVPAHAVVVDAAHPNTIYIGTDVGVWKGVKSGNTPNWALFSQGLPEAAILDLGIHAQARLLRAATYGRGVWEIAIDASAGQDPDLYLRANSADSGRMDTTGARFSWVNGGNDPTAGAAGTLVSPSMSADIKVRPGSQGALAAPVDFVAFETLPRDAATADLSGPNQIFIQVHNRSLTQVPGDQVRVLLMLAAAFNNNIPALPNGYDANFKAGNTSNWLAGSGWQFADPANPYRTLPGTLLARVPQVVEYDVDFSASGLGFSTVCAVALVTTAADPFQSTGTDVLALTMHDKHVGVRLLTLPGGSSSSSSGSSSSSDGSSSSSSDSSSGASSSSSGGGSSSSSSSSTGGSSSSSGDGSSSSSSSDGGSSSSSSDSGSSSSSSDSSSSSSSDGGSSSSSSDGSSSSSSSDSSSSQSSSSDGTTSSSSSDSSSS